MLPQFAAANPSIEINVSPKPNKHPVVVSHYIIGKEKFICMRNMQPNEIAKRLEVLRQASGFKPKRVTKPVTSVNESVRGVWSPYHGQGLSV